MVNQGGVAHVCHLASVDLGMGKMVKRREWKKGQGERPPTLMIDHMQFIPIVLKLSLQVRRRLAEVSQALHTPPRNLLISRMLVSPETERETKRERERERGRKNVNGTALRFPRTVFVRNLGQ